MYDVPSSENGKVVITEQTINEEIEPELYDDEGNLINKTRHLLKIFDLRLSHVNCDSVFICKYRKNVKVNYTIV